MTHTDPTAEIMQRFPLHGPYNSDTTANAGRVVDELIRYLNYATRSADALPWPAAAYDLIGALKSAAEKLPQALEQTGLRFAAFAERPDLVDRTGDWYRRPERAHDRAVQRAEEVRAGLRAAADFAVALAHYLADVHNLISPLGLDDSADDQTDE